MSARLSVLWVVAMSCDGSLTSTVKHPPDLGGGAAVTSGGTAATAGGAATTTAGGGSVGAGGGTGATTGGGLVNGGGGTATAEPRFSCSQPLARGTTFPTLHRLTRAELIATWSALLGSTIASDAQVVAALTGLPNDELQTLSTVSEAIPPSWVPALSSAARRSASLLLAAPAERTRVLGACTTQTLTDACVTQVITGFGARVWRRDLESAEVQSLLAFYRTNGGGDAGLGFLVRRLLQAPTLAFHLEDRGSIDGVRLRLTPFEVASRIAFLTTGATPDDALLAAARANQLTTTAHVRGHVLRLLDTPGGHARVRDLFRYYLQLGQVSDPFAPLATLRGLTPGGLGQELRAEALDFSEAVFFDQADGSFRQLMTSTMAQPKTERVARIFGQTCAGAAASTSFTWNDPNAFFHPDGAAVGAAVQTLTRNGWFVWQLPAGRFTHAVTELRVELTVTGSTALLFDVNLDDAPLLRDVSVAPGAGTIRATVALAGGAPAKVGLYLKNAGAGRTATLTSLTATGGSTARCVPGPAPTHPGVLHRPALLAGTAERTSPILRGAHVRKLFLCTTLSTPDPALVTARQTQVGDLDALANTQRVSTLTSAPECIGCHGLVNPLGFAFEGFDQAGMPRTEEQRFDAAGMASTRLPIDTTSTNPYLDFMGAGPGSVANSKELVEALAVSRMAQACFTQRAFEFMRRAPIDTAKDGCVLAAAEARAGTGSLRDVLADLVASDDLFFRPAP